MGFSTISTFSTNHFGDLHGYGKPQTCCPKFCQGADQDLPERLLRASAGLAAGIFYRDSRGLKSADRIWDRSFQMGVFINRDMVNIWLKYGSYMVHNYWVFINRDITKWLVFVREKSHEKWMMSGGTPMTQETNMCHYFTDLKYWRLIWDNCPDSVTTTIPVFGNTP